MSQSKQTSGRGYDKSSQCFAQACRLMPGGVNSPVRAYQAVGRQPVVIASGSGCRVIDVDGNDYIDYVGSFGPLILGHAHEAVVAAVTKAARRGMTFGMPTELERQLAEKVVQTVPSVEVVRFVNSGTEAVMSALRVARGATGRDKIVKCVGGYHGHSDGLLVSAGSGATTLGVPSSPGVPAQVAGTTLLMAYNDLSAARTLLEEHRGEVAAVIVEPVAGNMGCVPPVEGYLEGLRQLCDEHDCLLVFDEVMTGFRVASGGAQELYRVKPDLTALGKVIGGGLPCAAYGGREDLMRQVAPDGPIYQAGTLSGNPLAMAAGLATLEQLDAAAYDRLESLSSALEDGLRAAADKAGLAVQVNRVGSMLTPFFTDRAVVNYDDATACDTRRFGAFFRALLDEGVVIPPSQFEAWFVSTAHDEQAIEQTIDAAGRAMQAAAEAGD